MKGLAFRKLSRTTSHRRALLRNLVTSLIQNERINTTVAKAKEAQRLAEKVITKAKRGLLESRIQQKRAADAYVFEPNTTVPILQQLAQRYANRPGGYTRILLNGRRKGDNAPLALLELVDQPRGDLKLEMTALAMGREMYMRVKGRGPQGLQEEASQLGAVAVEHDERFADLTRIKAERAVLFGGDAARELLAQKARAHMYRLMAMRQLEGDHRVDEDKVAWFRKHNIRGIDSTVTLPMRGARRLAGMRKDFHQSGPDEPEPKYLDRGNSVIRIGKGAFARRVVRQPLVPLSEMRRKRWLPSASKSKGALFAMHKEKFGNVKVDN